MCRKFCIEHIEKSAIFRNVVSFFLKKNTVPIFESLNFLLSWIFEIRLLQSTIDLEYFISISSRPLVLDTVSVSYTFNMNLYRHIDTFLMENVSVYEYILCCPILFLILFHSFFDQNMSKQKKFFHN